ncbi:outer membrane protein assembly factor BamE [Chromobacterium sphagni]|uniref:outer membrane protein assembly factor BamE n=1 Tax=Chromobacterium sphagni TaxID=1903179 RepID=UPI001114537E|nr:outer membrane protein assembly factor BamE [Chromobacterium sphagni]
MGRERRLVPHVRLGAALGGLIRQCGCEQRKQTEARWLPFFVSGAWAMVAGRTCVAPAGNRNDNAFGLPRMLARLVRFPRGRIRRPFHDAMAAFAGNHAGKIQSGIFRFELESRLFAVSHCFVIGGEKRFCDNRRLSGRNPLRTNMARPDTLQEMAYLALDTNHCRFREEIKMKKTILTLSLLAATMLSGCAGTNFKRPDAGALTLGQSTAADVARVMGEPQQSGEAMKNDQTIKLARYAYASTSGAARYPGVTPARAMVFSTFKDVLVGEEFNSSFAEDATDFDEGKVSALRKGATTRSEVIALLGKPSGEAIYPIIKSKTGKGVVYAYTHVTGTVFNMKLYSKLLVVSFDERDVVSDVEYSSSGSK